MGYSSREGEVWNGRLCLLAWLELQPAETRIGALLLVMPVFLCVMPVGECDVRCCVKDLNRGNVDACEVMQLTGWAHEDVTALVLSFL